MSRPDNSTTILRRLRTRPPPWVEDRKYTCISFQFTVPTAEMSSTYRQCRSCNFPIGDLRHLAMLALSAKELVPLMALLQSHGDLLNCLLGRCSSSWCNSMLIPPFIQKEASKALERAITLASRQTLRCIRSSSFPRSPQAPRLYAAHRLHPKSTKVCP